MSHLQIGTKVACMIYRVLTVDELLRSWSHKKRKIEREDCSLTMLLKLTYNIQDFDQRIISPISSCLVVKMTNLEHWAITMLSIIAKLLQCKWQSNFHEIESVCFCHLQAPVVIISVWQHLRQKTTETVSGAHLLQVNRVLQLTSSQDGVEYSAAIKSRNSFMLSKWPKNKQDETPQLAMLSWINLGGQGRCCGE